ncbi:MAG: winged helix-turn-helix domain-containing protein [Candidatus Hodarchaeota archaeon]
MELEEKVNINMWGVNDLKTPKKYENMRKELEIISEKTRYKILLTLLASEESLSFSRLRELLPSIPENTLNYHLKILKENDFIKNEKKLEYKRSEPRSFYSLSKKSINLLETLGLTAVREEFRALFKQMT